MQMTEPFTGIHYLPLHDDNGECVKLKLEDPEEWEYYSYTEYKWKPWMPTSENMCLEAELIREYL